MRMKKIFSILLLFALGACAPRIARAPEIVYSASSEQVFASLIRGISTAEPLAFSNGWIITQSDRAGGFIAASTSVRDLWYGGSTNEGVSVVISPQGRNRTAVVMQGSSGSRNLIRALSAALGQQFGTPQITDVVVAPQPVASSEPVDQTASHSSDLSAYPPGSFIDDEGNVWIPNSAQP